MSFSRHQKIYRSDLVTRELNSSSSPHGDHRFDESSTSYSSAGCSPAAPASASLANRSLALFSAAGNRSAANGNLSLISLSQPRGAVQLRPPISTTWLRSRLKFWRDGYE
jgi:hypothetical protein